MSHDLGRVKILCLMGAIIDSVVMGYLGRISDNVLQLCYDMRNGWKRATNARLWTGNFTNVSGKEGFERQKGMLHLANMSEASSKKLEDV